MSDDLICWEPAGPYRIAFSTRRGGLSEGPYESLNLGRRTGDDLAGLGVPEGPRVGEILGELRRRKLNGELDGREAELSAARELVGDE